MTSVAGVVVHKRVSSLDHGAELATHYVQPLEYKPNLYRAAAPGRWVRSFLLVVRIALQSVPPSLVHLGPKVLVTLFIGLHGRNVTLSNLLGGERYTQQVCWISDECLEDIVLPSLLLGH